MRIILMMCMVLFSQIAVGDSALKWVDENGVTQYGDRPVEGVDAEIIKLKKTPRYNKSKEEILEEQRRIVEMTPEERKKYEEDKNKAVASNAKECATGKERLATYKSTSVLTEFDAQGKKKTLTAKEREKVIKDLEDLIKQNCR